MERRRRLLLVEDESGLRSLVAQFLRFQQYEVVEAADGAEAIAFLDAPTSEPLDLVLLDLNLPHVHGVEVAAHLRRDRPTLPVIVCSAAIVSEHEQRLSGLGIRRFLTKPYHPEHLLQAITSATCVDPVGNGTAPGASTCDLVTPEAHPVR